ncbi:MAG TPA: hypothetical protein VGF76_10095, partial [Polyangiaceae bacterium]
MITQLEESSSVAIAAKLSRPIVAMVASGWCGVGSDKSAHFEQELERTRRSAANSGRGAMI